MPVTIKKIAKKKTTLSVLGIDPSTKTGWAFVKMYDDQEVPTAEASGVAHFKKLSGMGRVVAFKEWMVDMLNNYKPDLVMIEGYGYANQHTLVPLVEIGTVLRLAIFEQQAICEVAPTQLKKFVCSKGNAKKNEMMKEVFKRWGFEGQDDEVDAYALAVFGLCILGEYQPPTKAAGQAVADWVENHGAIGCKLKAPVVN